jgi:hypothetical protein
MTAYLGQLGKLKGVLAGLQHQQRLLVASQRIRHWAFHRYVHTAYLLPVQLTSDIQTAYVGQL